MPSWLAGFVFDLAHLVHVDERVEVGGADSGERAHDGKALAFIASWAGGDGADGAFGVRRAGAAIRGSVKVSAVIAGMQWVTGLRSVLFRFEYRQRGCACVRRGARGEHGFGSVAALLTASPATSFAPTPCTAAAAEDNDVTPRPVSTHASSGSAAASPQTPTGLSDGGTRPHRHGHQRQHRRLPRDR